MDRLVKARKPLRISFTKTYEAALAELGSQEPVEETIRLKLKKLERLAEELREKDERILELLIDGEDSGKYDDEYMVIEEYRDRLEHIRIKVEIILNALTTTLTRENSGGSHNSEISPTSPMTTNRKKLKLPKLELKKFNGEIKDWIGFWSQFKRIHDDHEIDTEDKFQYLIQATESGTRVREIVECYPPTAENYEKVIESLKNRFGREELLIEYYVRELLGLVIQNTSGSNSKARPCQLYDRLESHLRALESIGMTSDKYAAMLFPLVESCLPEDVLRIWLRNQSSKPVNEDLPGMDHREKLNQLLIFLRNEVEGEERISLARTGFPKSTERQKGARIKCSEVLEETLPSASNLFSGEKQKGVVQPSCVFCERPHDSRNCMQARRMNLSQKREVLMKKRCCFLCFKSGHRSKVCKTGIRCLVCNKNHEVVMCPHVPINKENAEEKIKGKSEVPSSTSLSNPCSSLVLLQTLMVKLKGNNRERVVRALIDTGSQRSYILKRTALEMGYESVGSESLVHVLFGGSNSSRKTHSRYNVSLSGLRGNYSYTALMLDQEAICGSIPSLGYGPWIKELKDKRIWLTDLGKDQKEIELLIGSDIAGHLFTGKRCGLKSGLVAMETHLGWVVMGRVPVDSKNINGNFSVANTVTSLLIHNGDVADLWKLDVIGITDPVETKNRKESEQSVVEQFLKTVVVNEEGRYEVQLPWKEGHEVLNDNKRTAEKRLMMTTTKLLNNGKYQEYQAVFEDWLSEGIIEEIPKEEAEKFGYYLPHRGVFKENSTTNVRPVFDASCRSAGSPSLNDCLEKGPNLLELIPSVLIRFREKSIGVVSDIQKAFLQISVSDTDRDFLRFLWWETLDEKKLKIFRHRRVVFGVNCSPFLLAAVINFHLSRASPELRYTAEKLKSAFYVDNCVTSVETEEELVSFIHEARILLAKAKFNLRGWQNSMLENETEVADPTSVLGLLWDRQNDTIFCDVPLVGCDIPLTRRCILSIAHKIFDPIGFSCPVTLIPKLLLQESWQLKMSWDAEVPKDIEGKFRKWVQDLPLLSLVRISRHISSRALRETWSLHTFCDASRSAYAAVVFLRSEGDREVNVQLVMAKSRVSPLRKITIPRLELMACCIGTRLANSVIEAINLKNVPLYFWTDSSTSLCWITRHEQWGVFVNNRVKEIRALTPTGSWRHVPGDLNPADLPSRGCSAEKLVESRWWEGPKWLKLDEASWPNNQVSPNEEDVILERRKTPTQSLLITTNQDKWYLKYFSKYSKILKMIGWILRFVTNSRRRVADRFRGELSVEEINAAEKRLLKFAQEESFGAEENPSLKALCTFRDKEGLIRVQTRITGRSDKEEFKTPIVLPSQHEVTKLLIRESHLMTSHAGVTMLLSNLRERFWILKGRKTVRSVVSRCVKCRRYEAKSLETCPVALPEDRVRDSTVFEVTGVDLAGPLNLKTGEKAWIVLFTCAVYRAVHLELTTSLSTASFLQSFRRFVARRGRPKIMYSDNGTNFVGTENLFKTIDWKKVGTDASVMRIQWKFNPPTAAWWGGWWERIVQMVKKLLRRVLGRASLNYEEMMTVIYECEAVINSRPLTYLSEDPKDLMPLTPSMFLQDTEIVGVPDLDQLDQVNLSKRLRYVQRLRQDLKKRFRNEYLGQLIQKPKSGHQREVKVGDVVLVGSDNRRRIDWPVARVVRLIPGKDKKVRVVQLRTSTGDITRPVQRVYPLEVSLPNETNDENKVEDASSINEPSLEPSRKTFTTKSGRRVTVPMRYPL